MVHQLRLLRVHGARRVVLCVGYLGDQIEAAIGDGQWLDLEVAYSYDSPQLDGTAGALRGALSLLGPEFLVLYGDTYLRIDYAEVLRSFRASGLPALMTVLRNERRWDRSNAVYEDGRVTAYDKSSPTPQMQWIDYGLGAMRASVFDAFPDAVGDLADVYRELAARDQLAGYEATKRFYEIGTPEALAETDAWLRSQRS